MVDDFLDVFCEIWELKKVVQCFQVVCFLENVLVMNGCFCIIGGMLWVDFGGFVVIVGMLLIDGIIIVIGIFKVIGLWWFEGNGMIMGDVLIMGNVILMGMFIQNGVFIQNGQWILNGVGIIVGNVIQIGDMNQCGNVIVNSGGKIIVQGGGGNVVFDSSFSVLRMQLGLVQIDGGVLFFIFIVGVQVIYFFENMICIFGMVLKVVLIVFGGFVGVVYVDVVGKFW